MRQLAARSILSLLFAWLITWTAEALAQTPTPLSELNGSARVVRDAQGIPHIFATDEHDLFFLQGWVHAEDRLFQMDLFRRQASGTLAELLGPDALESDVQLRIIGLRRAAERSLPLLSEPVMDAFEAYTDGVNAFIESHPLSPEYQVLEISQIEPWSPLDSMVISKLFAFELSFDLDIAPTLTFLQYQGVGQAAGFDGTALYFEDLFRSAPFDPASTIPDATDTMLSVAALATEDGKKSRLETASLASSVATLANEYLSRARKVPLLRAAVDPADRPHGSNEWVASGVHSATGKPLLANDPHLTLPLPSIFYEIQLMADGIDVIGSSLAGTPFVLLGHNRFIAWGATTNPMDVTDTFQEQVVFDFSSPSLLSTVHDGEREPIIPLLETFHFNQVGDDILDNLALAIGRDIPAAVLTVPRRLDGPIVALDIANGVALSVQYAGFAGTREPEAFYLWNLARDLEDFEDGLRSFDVGSQNFAVADQFGEIAYYMSGALPLREDLEAGTIVGSPPFFIRNGTGGNEWLPSNDGEVLPFMALPFEEMPKVIDPPAGLIVSANNDPVGTTLDNDPLNQLRPGGGILYFNPNYSSSLRAGRITEVLREGRDAGSQFAVADFQALQADTVMLEAKVFVPFILDAFTQGSEVGANTALAALAADPRVAEAVRRFEAWDFSTPTGIAEGFDADDVAGEALLPPTDDEVAASVAATIYAVWRSRFVANVSDQTLAPFGLTGPRSEQALAALRHLLDNFAAGHGVGASGLDFFQVPGVSDAETRRDIKLLLSLQEALDRLASPDFDAAFNGATDQDQYRWGQLHRIVFAHPLDGPFSAPPAGGDFPPPLSDLSGIPTDGAFGTVDVARHDIRAADANAFTFFEGPAKRFVASVPPGQLHAETSLPGGESGVVGEPHYVDLLERWLVNDSFRLLTNPGEISREASAIERFVPAVHVAN
jgi:penicillin amidase